MRADPPAAPGAAPPTQTLDRARAGAPAASAAQPRQRRGKHSRAAQGPAGGAGYRAVKRLLDLLLAAVMLGCTLPLLVVACALVPLETPGPPFFLQWRSGLHGRPFRIVKLRTMVTRADRLGPPLTQAGDPRITKVGAVLRRWSIDELPQLLNVLAGQMSLVGPRPELVPIVATYPPRYRQVLSARPGLTGWAQVNGRDDLPITAKLGLELDYLARRCTRADLAILARTVRVVLSGQGTTR
jgi:lipopolysaccharide/colanic/teichoic acid biosynthesis glycosyltransferase